MLLRSQETAKPVLVGLVPGVTATVNRVESPAKRVLGEAAPTPVGFVGVGTKSGVSEKSSTANPSSELDMSKSVQRIQKLDPSAMFNPLIAKLIAVRFPDALPSNMVVAALMLGLFKSRLSLSVHVPDVRLVALVLT